MQPTQFSVYNASAGSGKTFTLVKEYLKILLSTNDVFRFQHILAVTFTNKAAIEMKTRVLETLRAFSEGEQNDMIQSISHELQLDEELIRKKAEIILNTILQHYSSFNITTIDSFTYRIIKSFAFDLGLSLNFEVEMDVKTLLDEAVDVLISKIGEQKELTDTLINFSLDKLDEDKSWDISYDLRDIAGLLLNENNFIELNKISDKSIDDFTALNKQLRKEQKEIELKFKTIGKQALDLIEDNDLMKGVYKGNYVPKHFANLVNDFKKAKFFDQTKLKYNIENNTIYNASAESKRAILDGIEPKILNAYYTSEALYSQHLLNSLVLKSLIPLAVLKHINASLNTIKEQNNIRLNAEFNKIISDQIIDEPAPFIYERLGEKFRYYFIDEMQDTSEMQWQNLIPLIENALVSETPLNERGKLMLVGDAKQAIYRWRGGKSEQFIELTNKETIEPFNINKEVLNLDTNYRSQTEIINFTNKFFSYSADIFKNKNYKKIYEAGNKQNSTNKKGGYVEISFVENDEQEQIFASTVYEKIEQLVPEYDLNEICVLVRTKKQGIEVANYLTEHEIPIVSSETLQLKNNHLIEFIVDVLYFIQNPNNDEVKADILYFLAHKLKKEDATHAFMARFFTKSKENLFVGLQEEGINFDLESFIELTLYDAVEYIIRSFHLINSSDAYINSFLDLVLEYQTKKGTNTAGFLEFWERKKDNLSIAMPDGDNAVKIMTVHKSKGLEFPVVIFPYDLNIYQQIKPKAWYTQLDKEKFNGFDTTLIDYSKRLSYIGEYGKDIYNQVQSELELDNLNLLYVALTRPIEQLYVITEKKEKPNSLGNAKYYSDLFSGFILNESDHWKNEGHVYYKGDRNRCKQEQDSNTINSESLDAFISTSWKDHNISIVSKSSSLWETKQQEAISYGNLIHEILSKVKTKDDIPMVLQEYTSAGVISQDFAQEIKLKLEELVYHPKLTKYFGYNIEVYNEQELITNDKRIKIPDRLVVLHGKMTIIDYKTGIHKKSYTKQIQEYADVLRELKFTIEKMLIVYLNDNVEVVEIN